MYLELGSSVFAYLANAIMVSASSGRNCASFLRWSRAQEISVGLLICLATYRRNSGILDISDASMAFSSGKHVYMCLTEKGSFGFQLFTIFLGTPGAGIGSNAIIKGLENDKDMVNHL